MSISPRFNQMEQPEGCTLNSLNMTKRIIARLDIKGENVVRGIHLEGLRVVGQPEQMAAKYCDDGVDEIVFIDTVASLYGRNKILPVIERTAEHAFIPLTVGGGVRTLQDVDDLLRAGADKITLNSAAVRNPQFITDIAVRFGSQCVVSAIEAKRIAENKWTVLIENARETTGLDAIEWARRVYDSGAGEILLTSIDKDGTRKGFDLELTRTVSEMLPIPVITSGGPGNVAHVVEAFREGKADAVALGTLLHFNLATIKEVKQGLEDAGLSVRGVSHAK
jgi:cyclase